MSAPLDSPPTSKGSTSGRGKGKSYDSYGGYGSYSCGKGTSKGCGGHGGYDSYGGYGTREKVYEKGYGKGDKGYPSYETDKVAKGKSDGKGYAWKPYAAA